MRLLKPLCLPLWVLLVVSLVVVVVVVKVRGGGRRVRAAGAGGGPLGAVLSFDGEIAELLRTSLQQPAPAPAALVRAPPPSLSELYNMHASTTDPEMKAKFKQLLDKELEKQLGAF